ncbi:GGDEF domain-containing protein [Rhodocyclus tenuis]|uniref:GGDEF domain-containing protein n=1 Tax=Rhodocyclus tenuis TaxID=1066 RepID=UPI001905EB60|nr:GGDEF domain-containing protein [Rhodocyclus tenuis]MBK1679258.1 hypothetical protein [Rhodocyclus tenuis]
MQPDVPIMAMMISVAALTMSGAMLWLTHGLGSEGLKQWGWGLFTYAVALPVLTLRPMVPEPLSIVAGNTLLAGAVSLMLWGYYRFLKLPANRWLIIGPVLLTTLCMLVFIDQLAARVIANGLISGTQALLMGVIVYRHRQLTPGRGYQLLLAGCCIGVTIFYGRFITVGSGAVTHIDSLGAHLLQTLSFVGSLASVMLDSLGFIGMIKERADERNRRLAMFDELTGIANRRAILDEFGKRFSEALRHRLSLCVLMIDVDHFKQVNDSYGHQAGDRVLKAIAEAIGTRLRTQDSVGRYGGEEFMVVLPNTSHSCGMLVAEKLRCSIRSTPIDIDGRTLTLSASIGVLGSPITAGSTVDAMIRASDAALYRAKSLGRDRVEQGVLDMSQT